METFPYHDLPIDYSQIYSNQNDGQADGGGAIGSVGGGLSSGQVTPRRSLSQTILSQMSSPTTAFGLTGRSPSPSPFVNNALSRKSSFNNRNFMSRGPSLQSLVKSFINRVSRGTQTDCDDNFDAVSIASVTSGFSAIASDLTRSRLNLFLNDNPTRYTKSYASSSQVDDNDFVEELQKLRGEINGQFGAELDPVYTENQFDFDDMIEEPQSVCEKKNYRKVANAKPKVITCDQEAETDGVDKNECSTQTETPKETQVVEKAIETEPEAVQSKPAVSKVLTQTDALPEMITKPPTRDSETQTDLLKFCEHCAGGQLQDAREPAAQNKAVQAPIVVQQPQPQIMKCEFLISHADIICKENKLCVPQQPESKSVYAQVTTVEPTSQEQAPAKSDVNGEVSQSEPATEASSTEQPAKEAVVEEVSEMKVHNLEVQINAATNGHHANGANQANGEQKRNAHGELENGSVPNGTLTKEDKKKKKKEKKTPKKSPRKTLVIIPGKDDEEREMNHQAALTHVKPKCCTIS